MCSPRANNVRLQRRRTLISPSVHQRDNIDILQKPAFQASCLGNGCIATFEPLIQVKSEAVDTGRGFFSRAHAQISEDLVLYGHVVCCGHVLSVRDDEGKLLGLRLADFVDQPRLVMHAKHGAKTFLSTSLFCTQNMDTLDNTEWDVLIVGTGLQQSLLALYVYRTPMSWRMRSD